jgi:hypothetical protein
MCEMEAYGYDLPVAQLLTLGEPGYEEDWADYVALGLRREHAPDLIRMVEDQRFDETPSDSPEVWAPLHAWRALAQLGATEAIEPLLGKLADLEDDWAGEDIPEALGRIGPAALPSVAVHLADRSRDWLEGARLAQTLVEIEEHHPEARERCVGILAEQLRHHAEQEPETNAYLVSALADMAAKETLPLIKEAYKADDVDTDVADLFSVRGDMGDLSEEERGELDRRESAWLRGENPDVEPVALTDLVGPPSRAPSKPASKAKRKQADKSRKANRPKSHKKSRKRKGK